MYKVYFDGIEQSENDIININEVAEFTIIREDGFTSDEQILREKTEMEIQFCRQAYSYICNKIGTDRCAEIDFRIEETESGMYFLGVIPVTLCELNLHERTGKTKVKDNSFSAYIRDFIDTEVRLFNTSSKNCVPIETPEDIFILKNEPANDTDTVTITAFDALETIQYLVSYFTDDTIDVVSTYLTANKYAITTGFNMHNYATSAKEFYPSVSIVDIFSELRKKLRLYMGIEYDVANRPYLRIEQEDYFFSNTVPLFSIAGIVPKTVQTYDTQRNFNNINVGSTDYELQDGSDMPYVQEDYTAWNDESFIGCGTCTGDRDNDLDLVSEFIIDSNVIYEALNWGATDYANDDKLFMFNYTTSAGSNISVRTLSGGNYYYNATLTNDNVLANWIDYYGKCLALQRQYKYGFRIIYPSFSGQIQVPVSLSCAFYNMNYTTTVYDNLNTIYTDTKSQTECTILTYMDSFEAFKCQENGDYNFKAVVANISQDPNGDYGSEVDDLLYRLSINVYSDDTFTTLVDTYEQESEPAGYSKVTITTETGLIPLSVGNVVMVTFRISATVVVSSFDIDFPSDYASFELVGDGFGCESLEYNDQNSKPFLLDFQYPLCYQDYATARDNKNGYVTVAGKRFWIKELTYRHKRLSTLKLMGNDSLCGCVPLADFSDDFNNDFT